MYRIRTNCRHNPCRPGTKPYAAYAQLRRQYNGAPVASLPAHIKVWLGIWRSRGHITVYQTHPTPGMGQRMAHHWQQGCA